MRILMPSIVDPSIQMGGAWTVTRELLRLLREGPLDAEVEVIACRRYSAIPRHLRQISSVARSLVSPVPAKMQFVRSRRLLAEVQRQLTVRRFDLVAINGGDLLWLLPHLPPALPRVLIAHNIESQLFASQLSSGGLLERVLPALAAREQRRLHAFELDGIRQVARAVFLSTADEAFAQAQCPGLEAITVPPVFWDAPAPRPCRQARADRTIEIGLLANLEWWPNERGLAWFLEQIFPHAPRHIRLHLFGKGSLAAVTHDSRIVAHGWVEDLRQVWSTCDFMICPTQCGAGVSVKFAEAVYRGMPVLGTHLAARGLPLDSHPAIALLDRAEDWIRFLNRDAAGFGGQQIPLWLAARFHAAPHARALSAFLRR